ncbi:hypothetical protein ACFQ2K_49810 [Streptomyces sanglieri]|uniref:Uncharacterized protein n=1 Tax=Streptomyces sanglieri TaxID=193460 RepID=A0ABW2X6R0_9ACTN
MGVRAYVSEALVYLATTAELSRRFARIYTTLGTHDPLYRRFCLYRERDFREAPG